MASEIKNKMGPGSGPSPAGNTGKVDIGPGKKVNQGGGGCC